MPTVFATLYTLASPNDLEIEHLRNVCANLYSHAGNRHTKPGVIELPYQDNKYGYEGSNSLTTD
jgi:hypothetical protein